MPFREDSAEQRTEIKDIVVGYYNSRGIDVILYDSPTEKFNKYCAMNLIMESSDLEPVCIVNADAIVPHFFLEEGVAIARKTGRVVKPFDRVANIDVKNKKFISNIYEDDILDDFDFISAMPEFHHGTSWIMTKEAWQSCGHFDDTYGDSGLGNLDFSFMSAITCGLTYLGGLSYTFAHGKITPYWNIENQIDKLKNMQKFFNDSEMKVYVKSFNEEYKMPQKDCIKLFDPDEYIERYQLGYFLSKMPSSTKSENL